MSAIIKQAKHLIAKIDLPLLSQRAALEAPEAPVVQLYYSESDSLPLAKAVYDTYLSPFNGPALESAEGSELYSRLMAIDRDEAELFLCYLYLRHLGEIDDQGLMINYQTVDYCYYTENILKLAHYYHLSWLQKCCATVLRQTRQDERVTGPLLRRGDELIVVGQDRLLSVGLPPQTKAFTVSADGHTWYALACPSVHVIVLWLRMTGQNTWRMIARTIDRQMAPVETVQLTLADHTCLYMLFNGQNKKKRQLMCYNMTNYHWLKLDYYYNYFLNKFGYVMTETGDESLPVTLTLNDHLGSVIVISHSDSVWTNAKVNLNNSQYLYTETALELKPQPSSPTTSVSYYADNDMFEHTPLDNMKIKLKAIDKRCPATALTKLINQKGLKRGSSDDDNATAPPFKRVFKLATARSLSQGLQFLKESGRDTEASEFDCRQFGYVVYTEATDPWKRVVVSDKQLFGQKASGEWWVNKVTYGYEKHVSGWRRTNPPLGSCLTEMVWDPRYDMMAVVRFDPEASTLAVNGRQRRLDLSNYNYSDQSLMVVSDLQGRYRYSPASDGCHDPKDTVTMKSGLDSLKNVQRTADGVFHYDSTVPLALDLLLTHLSPEPSEYANGGVREGPAHPVTNNPTVELYTLDPPTTHLVQKANYEALLRRYARPEPVEFLNVIGCVYDNKSPTQYLIGTQNRFIFMGINQAGVLVDNIV
ncbi:protein ORF109 [Lake sturgeon herpesvirus]|nr:protein ORF109 [Lake sturgeon herpesvirus]